MIKAKYISEILVTAFILAVTILFFSSVYSHLLTSVFFPDDAISIRIGRGVISSRFIDPIQPRIAYLR